MTTLIHTLVDRLIARVEIDDKFETQFVETNGETGLVVLSCSTKKATESFTIRVAKSTEQEIAMIGGLILDLEGKEDKPMPPILKFFAYAHLPEPPALVSAPFCHLAKSLVDTLPDNAERSVALRKLLEAKDAAVRAHL